MRTEPFDAAVDREAGVTIIRLHGELSGFAREVLDRAYEEAASRDSLHVLVDFADVGYINSTGIALVVDLLVRSRRDGRAILAYALSDHYQHIFHITRLTEYMPIYADEESALAAASTELGVATAKEVNDA